MRIVESDLLTVDLISDNNEVINWSVAAYKKTRYKTLDNVFRDINGYWGSLSFQRRASIFQKYKEIKEILDSVSVISEVPFDLSIFSANLINAVSELYKLMPFSEINAWVQKHALINYPDNLRIEHDHDDPMPDRTYLLSDYKGLVALTVALRPMVPIWGIYIKITEEASGVLFKEFSAFRLMGRTDVVISAPYDRLMRYIECCFTKQTDVFSAIISGLPKEEIPSWLLAVIAVRRLSACDIDASDTNGNIITNVYGFVTTTLDDLNKRFGNFKESKKKKGDNSLEDGEGSMLETYRCRQTISTGDVMKYNVYANDILKMARHVDSTIPEDLVALCLEASDILMSNDISKVQITLLQWIMSSTISPNAIPNLYKRQLINTIIAAQALLIHWGFCNVALLLSSVGTLPTNSSVSIAFNKIKIDDALVKQLNSFYPYKMNTEATQKFSNQAQVAIIKLAELVVMCTWQPTVTDNLLQYLDIELDLHGKIRLTYKDQSMVNQLASLVLFLNNRQEN